jgi:hypothetical protein
MQEVLISVKYDADNEGYIDGSNIIGSYGDNTSIYGHGFIYEIPEPSTLLLLGLGMVMLRRK